MPPRSLHRTRTTHSFHVGSVLPLPLLPRSSNARTKSLCRSPAQPRAHGRCVARLPEYVPASSPLSWPHLCAQTALTLPAFRKGFQRAPVCASPEPDRRFTSTETHPHEQVGVSHGTDQGSALGRGHPAGTRPEPRVRAHSFLCCRDQGGGPEGQAPWPSAERWTGKPHPSPREPQKVPQAGPDPLSCCSG